MDWTQVSAIIGVNIALAGATIGFVVWAVGKLHGDINGLSSRLDSHARRIDQLYQMFVELLKERKNP